MLTKPEILYMRHIKIPMKNPNELPFDWLFRTLKLNSYNPEVQEDSVLNFRHCRFKGHGVQGGFCEPNGGSSYSAIDGRVAFDKTEWFDKYSRCYYSLTLPENEREMIYLFESMREMEQGIKKVEELTKKYPFN